MNFADRHEQTAEIRFSRTTGLYYLFVFDRYQFLIVRVEFADYDSARSALPDYGFCWEEV